MDFIGSALPPSVHEGIGRLYVRVPKMTNRAQRNETIITFTNAISFVPLPANTNSSHSVEVLLGEAELERRIHTNYFRLILVLARYTRLSYKHWLYIFAVAFQRFQAEDPTVEWNENYVTCLHYIRRQANSNIEHM